MAEFRLTQANLVGGDYPAPHNDEMTQNFHATGAHHIVIGKVHLSMRRLGLWTQTQTQMAMAARATAMAMSAAWGPRTAEEGGGGPPAAAEQGAEGLPVSTEGVAGPPTPAEPATRTAVTRITILANAIAIWEFSFWYGLICL